MFRDQPGGRIEAWKCDLCANFPVSLEPATAYTGLEVFLCQDAGID